ncbi:MAG: hypothetical protein J6V34_03395 [Oscillospiraceae bacterium]|nr:hypothetical protein [Oscillospiraceae bacterium]
MKKLSIIVIFSLLVALLAGCVATPVVICTCPTGGEATQPTVPVEGAVKTGLAIVTNLRDSKNAELAKFDVTLVAVLVDDQGVIVDCVIDSIGADVTFDATGTITSALSEDVATKNELGDSYNMVGYGGAKYEWYQQADALAKFALGKTAEELKNGAIDETGYAPAGSDLASSATIYLGGYVNAIAEAVANAKHLGAQGGDELILASCSNTTSSLNATTEENGTAQLNCDATALTVKDGKITSCYIDSVQAKVSFDATGTITTDITSGAKTKNQLGKDYNMMAWGGAKYEWNEQAASFAAYITGKTAAEVAGIAVTEGKPSDADLAASVTISIADFQNLIAKALR